MRNKRIVGWFFIIIVIAGTGCLFVYKTVLRGKQNEQQVTHLNEISGVESTNPEALSNNQSVTQTPPVADGSLGSKLPPSQADLAFDALVDQTTEEIINVHKNVSHISEDKLEKTKQAFNEAFDNPRPGDVIENLIEDADEDEKKWMYNALMDKFDSAQDPSIRIICLGCILMYGDKAKEMYVKGLLDEDRRVRISAAHIAGSRLTENEIPFLYQLIKEDIGILGRNCIIASDLIRALGGIGGKKASATLMKIWNDKELSKGREGTVLQALGESGDVDNFRFMESVLKGNDPGLRGSAVPGLGLLALKIRIAEKKHPNQNSDNDRQVVKDIKALLVNCLNEKDYSIRFQAVYALKRICDPEDIKIFETLLDDEYSTYTITTKNGERTEGYIFPIREMAKEAIVKMGK